MEPIVNPTKKQLRTLRGIVYAFRHKINGKHYVGQTVNNFNTRYRRQDWGRKVYNRHLRNSLLKNGIQAFDIIILEHGIRDKAELNRLEEEHAIRLNAYSPIGYNIRPCGDGQGKATPEMRERCSENAAFKEWRFKNIISGEVFTIRNLVRFCKERNLIWGKLERAINLGRGRSYEGYTGLETTLDDIANYSTYRGRRTLLMGPYTLWKGDKEYVVTDIMAFMREHHIPGKHDFCDLLEGKIEAHKGFTRRKGAKIFSPTQRYFNIRLLNRKREVEIFDGSKHCMTQTRINEEAFYHLMAGKRTEAKGYRLLGYDKRIPSTLVVV